jgi:hypothetical protein
MTWNVLTFIDRALIPFTALPLVSHSHRSCHLAHFSLQFFREFLQRRFDAGVRLAALSYECPLLSSGLAERDRADHDELFSSIVAAAQGCGGGHGRGVVKLVAADEDRETVVVGVDWLVHVDDIFCCVVNIAEFATAPTACTSGNAKVTYRG